MELKNLSRRLISKFDWQRWWYRRMAWKNDPSLWCNMHPRIAKLLDDLYEPSFPIRDMLWSLGNAARNKATIQAARDVYGIRDIEVWPGDYGASAKEIYERGAEQGWTGKRNSVHPYTRRELVEMRLHHYFKYPEAELATMNDTELFNLLDQENERERERKAQAKA